MSRTDVDHDGVVEDLLRRTLHEVMPRLEATPTTLPTASPAPRPSRFGVRVAIAMCVVVVLAVTAVAVLRHDDGDGTILPVGSSPSATEGDGSTTVPPSTTMPPSTTAPTSRPTTFTTDLGTVTFELPDGSTDDPIGTPPLPEFVVGYGSWMVQSGCILSITVQDVEPPMLAAELVDQFESNGLAWSVYDTGSPAGSHIVAMAVDGPLTILVGALLAFSDQPSNPSPTDVVEQVARTVTVTDLDVAATPPTTVPIPAGTTLREGDSGDAVRALQTELVLRGSDITVDGTFGPATTAAVKAAQRGAGLTADGIVGPLTIARLGLGTDEVSGYTTLDEYVDGLLQWFTTGDPGQLPGDALTALEVWKASGDAGDAGDGSPYWLMGADVEQNANGRWDVSFSAETNDVAYEGFTVCLTPDLRWCGVWGVWGH